MSRAVLPRVSRRASLGACRWRRKDLEKRLQRRTDERDLYQPLACTPAISTADQDRSRRSLLLSPRHVPGRRDLRSGPPRMEARNHSETGILFVADVLELALLLSSANRANQISDCGPAFRVARSPSRTWLCPSRPISCGGLNGLYAESSSAERRAGKTCAFTLNLDFKASRRARQSPG
jgi:hypothetical protein